MDVIKNKYDLLTNACFEQARRAVGSGKYWRHIEAAEAYIKASAYTQLAECGVDTAQAAEYAKTATRYADEGDAALKAALTE